jgi:hypothetical protein
VTSCVPSTSRSRRPRPVPPAAARVPGRAPGRAPGRVPPRVPAPVLAQRRDPAQCQLLHFDDEAEDEEMTPLPEPPASPGMHSLLGCSC